AGRGQLVGGAAAGRGQARRRRCRPGGAAKDHDVAAQKDTAKDHDVAAQKNTAKDYDVAAQKNTAKDYDVAAQKIRRRTTTLWRKRCCEGPQRGGGKGC
ncbi:hypothetical protein, partial [Rhizocola hellebori]|uniref:hypothetical protein n=1 Tax=Rhizocola hellebori TaxID=1392758 RepID=UPI0019423908